MKQYCLCVGPIFSKLYGAGWGWFSEAKYLKPETSYKIAGSEHFQAVKDGNWDGFASLAYMQGGAFVFPTGLLPRILEALMEKEVEWSGEVSTVEGLDQILEEVRFEMPAPLFPKPAVKFVERLGNGIELRPYQKRMVDSIALSAGTDSAFLEIPRNKVKHLSSGIGRDVLLRVGGRGVWKSATGSGKTIASAGLIGRLAVKTLFLVYSNDLVLQTWEVFKEVLGPWLSEVGWSLGLSYEGNFTEGNVTVAGTSTFVAIMDRPERLESEAKKSIDLLTTDAIPFLDAGKMEIFDFVRRFKEVLKKDPDNFMVLQDLGIKMSGLEVSVLDFGKDLEHLAKQKEYLAKQKEDIRSLYEKHVKRLVQYAEKRVEAQERKKKLRDYLESVQLLILDEAHSGAADGIYQLLMFCPAPYRLAMSGTPLDRSDGANLKILAAFGDLVANVSNKEMKEAGVVPSATIRFVEIEGRLKMFKGYRFKDVYGMGVVENQIRNRWICKLIQKAVREDKRVLVIFKAIEHGRVLSEMLSMEEMFGRVEFRCVDGRNSIEERKTVIEEFRAGVVNVVLASNIFGTGINIPEGIDVMINAAGGKTVIGTLQRLGRGLRGDGEIVLYDFADYTHKNLADHSKERVQIYQSQGCFDIEVVDLHKMNFED